MSVQKIRLILNKYISNQCSAKEVSLLFELIDSGDYDKVLKEEIDGMNWGSELENVNTDFPILIDVFDRILRSKKKA